MAVAPPRPESDPRDRAIMVGLLGAVGIVFYAFSMAGGGHGWIAPLWFSIPLLLIYPAVAVQTVGKDGPLWPSLLLAGAAIVGDILLRRNILSEEAEYFEAAGVWGRIWLIFWFGWQIVLVAAMANRLVRVRGPDVPGT